MLSLSRYRYSRRLCVSTPLTQCIRLIGSGTGKQKVTDKIAKIRKKRASSGAKSHLSRLFNGLQLLGLGFTAYAIYTIYGAMTMWPQELRKDLRTGLLAKREGDLDVAALCLSRAWEQAKLMHLRAFGEEPRLKTSGIAISLAGILEEARNKERAYQVYEDALRHIINGPSNGRQKQRSSFSTESLEVLTVTEGIRAVSISYKLGELARELRKPVADEEKWLVWSVDALLKIIIKEGLRADFNGTRKVSKSVQSTLDELSLPSWATLHSFAAPFEALGSFYARRGNIDYAIPLYLRAISVLIPPQSQRSSPDDRCRGAQLMGNIAELILRNHPSDNVPTEVLAQAEAWATKGLEITKTARGESFFRQHEICEEGYAVLLFNMAMIRQFAGDIINARKLFSQSLDQAKAIKMLDGISHAQAALGTLPDTSG